MPNDYSGKAIEVMGTAGGIMEDMVSDENMTHLTFSIPSRGTMGLKTKHPERYARRSASCSIISVSTAPTPVRCIGRKNGCMIAMATEKSVAYALDTLQERGKLFIGAWRGLLRGHDRRRVCQGRRYGGKRCRRQSNLGNQRSSGADKAISA